MTTKKLSFLEEVPLHVSQKYEQVSIICSYMKNSLVIILFDHPHIHTSDYSIQTGNFLRHNNIVIGVLMKDARSLKEYLISRHDKWLWKNETRNLHYFKPLYLIPFRRYKRVVYINNVLNIAFLKLIAVFLQIFKNVKNKYLWIFNPEQYQLTGMFGSAYISIYDCVDYHGHENNARDEAKLITTSDYVFVNSSVLFKKHHSLRNDIVLVPQGFDLKGFIRFKKEGTKEVKSDKPIVGYIGGINSRLDYSLLISLVKQNHHISFIFVGPVQIHEPKDQFDSLIKPKINMLFANTNVYYLGYLPKNRIPQIIHSFNIGMIPYDMKKNFNKFSYPMKLFEYFYMGKPVVSTPIDELEQFSKFVKIGSTPYVWSKHIKSLIQNPLTSAIKDEQKRLALSNSWEKKIGKIMRTIERNTL